MRLLPRRRPSAALVVSIVALVFAVGGSAYAVHRIDGALIKNGSIAGSKLKRKTLTGTQIDSTRLGAVPSARNAVNSQFSTTASVARSADNAINAGALGGQPAAAFQQRVRWALVSAGGGVLAASSSAVTASGGGGTYWVSFGASVVSAAIVVTPNGPTAPATAFAAAPCGGLGSSPGAVACAGPGTNDANHVQVQTGSAQGFYVAVIP